MIRATIGRSSWCFPQRHPDRWRASDMECPEQLTGLACHRKARPEGGSTATPLCGIMECRERNLEATGEDIMTIGTSLSVLSAIACASAALIAFAAHAGGDKVVFPENYASGALYTTVDRADNKQYRELSSVRRPRSKPPRRASRCRTDGHNARAICSQLDATVIRRLAPTGASSRETIGYTVMEKRAGWGAEYPDNVPNGEWDPGLQGGQDATRPISPPASIATSRSEPRRTICSATIG